MDAFEQHVRAGLELLGHDVDDADLAIMRYANAVHGPRLNALRDADLAAVWPEPDLDPGRAPSARFPAGGG